MGLLLYRGFARRLAGMPQTTTTSDDEAGRYGMLYLLYLLYLDAFIINPDTGIHNLY